MARSSFEAIGTAWTIDIFDDISHAEHDRLVGRVKERINGFDKTYSRFRPDSLIYQLAGTAGSEKLPADATALISLYRQFYEVTDGAMTPLVGSLLSDSGYDAAYSLRAKTTLRPVPAWDEALTYDPSSRTLTTHQPVILDFGAAGKGYLVDLVAGLLESHGIAGYCIDAGGDIRQHSVPSAEDRIGLEHPSLNNNVIGIASPGNRSLCGSAPNRRAWTSASGRPLHHIFDARSGKPAKGIAALWTVADSAILADALATALFFVGPQELKDRVGMDFEYAILYDSAEGLRLDHSTTFPAQFFIEEYA